MAASGAEQLRADARRNRDQILLAAREVFIDRGPDAALDEIARRAGVGNATLYRRFPDRQSLLRAVVLDVFREVAQQARRAVSEEAEPFLALARYMHQALDARIGAVMPALIGLIEADDEIQRARDDLTDSVREMIGRAQAERTLRPDVAEGDVGTILIRLSRPLPGLPAGLDQGLAHRHLDVCIEGLRMLPGRESGSLRGPATTLGDLRRAARHTPSRDDAADAGLGQGEMTPFRPSRPHG
jgi:AcrR family transcriptional regulator